MMHLERNSGKRLCIQDEPVPSIGIATSMRLSIPLDLHLLESSGRCSGRRHISGLGDGRLTSQLSDGDGVQRVVIARMLELGNDVPTALVVPLPSANSEVRDHCGKSALTTSMTV